MLFEELEDVILSSKKTSEVNKVTDELGVPVKTPKHDEKSTIMGINVLLAGIVVGAISPILVYGGANTSSVFFGAFFSVPLVAIIWQVLSTESTKPRSWHFAHLVPIAIVAPLVSVYAVMGSHGSVMIFVAVMGAIVGAIFSAPYAAYVCWFQKQK